MHEYCKQVSYNHKCPTKNVNEYICSEKYSMQKYIVTAKKLFSDPNFQNDSTENKMVLKSNN